MNYCDYINLRKTFPSQESIDAKLQEILAQKTGSDKLLLELTDKAKGIFLWERLEHSFPNPSVL